MNNNVRVSMRSELQPGCSFAVVEKGCAGVLILLRDTECAVFRLQQPDSRYLLLKHYPDSRAALRDFYKLVGKLCAKPAQSKYFLCPIDEDNRMVVLPDGTEHMLRPDEGSAYARRMESFLSFAADFMAHALHTAGAAIRIRPLTARDIPTIVRAEEAQGWHPSAEGYEMRLRDMQEGKCTALVAELDGQVAGYINLYYHPVDGPFIDKGWPVIVDFGVLMNCRRRGVGTALMDAAEALAAQMADTVCLGVGLHSGYGSAQRMYVKRGYLPDGSGAWYRGSVCPEYAPCANDDDLLLFLSKRLK